MSASPTIPAPSSKRPLEDPSSPSGPTDQPDAKRPALDKIVKGNVEDVEQHANDSVEQPLVVSSNGAIQHEIQATNGGEDAQGDTILPDAQGLDISTATGSRTQALSDDNHPRDESGWIHIRAVISSAEAATVIGKGGENVSAIRKMSGAKCTVSDYQKGAVERILTVSGLVDAVAKVRQATVHVFKRWLKLLGLWLNHSNPKQ